MFNRLMNRLVPKLEAYCARKGRTFNIYGKDEKKKVYLIRYILFKSPLFCIYIHRFMRSDNDRELHDHPFAFLSYLVKGTYTETRMFGEHGKGEFTGTPYCLNARFVEERRKQGSVAFRPARSTHRVSLDREYELHEKQDATLTVILRGPQTREWGFWKETGNPDHYKWIKWTNYLGETEADKKE